MLKEATHPQCGSTLGSCHDRLAYVNSFALDVFLFRLGKCFYNPRRLCCLLISQNEYSKPHTHSSCDSFSSVFSKCCFLEVGTMVGCFSASSEPGTVTDVLKDLKEYRNGSMDKVLSAVPLLLAPFWEVMFHLAFIFQTALSIHLESNPEPVSPSSTSPVWEYDNRKCLFRRSRCLIFVA